jgi:hypothetical protein
MNHTFATNFALKSALERAEALLEILDECGRAQEAKTLKAVIDSVREMRLAVGVVGQAKRGKSTLVNGLLGCSDDKFAPVDRFPATNVVSCFADGPKEKVTVLFGPDGGDAKTIPGAEIKHYACEDFNPGNQKGVKVIEVIAPFPRLGNDVVLVDTPGADNALSNLHDIVLLDYLPRLDAVIFLVTVDEPLTASELELLKQVKRSDVKKVLFAMNKADRCDSTEISQGLAHNRRVLADAGIGDAPIFTTSARNYQKTGTDVGTERLLFEVSEMIGAGRVKLILDRLNDIVGRHTAEARQELMAELQLCEMTAEQTNIKKADLVALRNRLAETRPRLERNFHTAWNSALSEFEDALPPIQKRMVSEYETLIDRTSALKMDALGQTVHTDVLKRLDELLEPPTLRLRAELEQAGRTLEVEYSSIPGLAPRQIGAVLTNKDMVNAAVTVVAAGVPSAIGAFVLSSLPGIVGSAIAAAAPAVAVATWNPLTWIAATGTGTAVAVTSAASGAATFILSPLAVVGAPLLIGYAGYRVFSSWKSKLVQSKNTLSLAVKDLIIAAVDETRENFKRLRKKEEVILAEFNNAMDAKLDESGIRLDEILKKGPTPERVINLKKALQMIERFEPAATSPSLGTDIGPPQRLFP